MSDSIAAASPSTSVWPRAISDPMLLIGLIIGFTPVLAGLIFRTYSYHVAPDAAEILRQLDVPFILAEIAVVMWAHHAGLRLRSVVNRLDRLARIALLIFFATFWLSSAFISENPGYSMIRASFWLVHIAFAAAVFHLVSTASLEVLVRLVAGLCAGFVVFLPLMAVHFAIAPDPASVVGGKIIWSSAIPGCLSIRHLGIWASLVLGLALGALYIRDGQPWVRPAVYAVIFVAVTTLFWSGTRSGVYGIVGAMIVFLATVRTLPPLRAAIAALATAAAGIWVSTLPVPLDAAFGIFHRQIETDQGIEALATGRWSLWTKMMDAFAGSPVFGVGEGAVHWIAAAGDVHHVQPHNSIVQMLSSWGVIASAAAAYLVLRLMVLVHRLARKDALAIPLALMLDCLLIMSLADGVLYFSRFIMWFAAGGAVALAMATRREGFMPSGPQPAPSAPSR